jgi:hypothetical protein
VLDGISEMLKIEPCIEELFGARGLEFIHCQLKTVETLIRSDGSYSRA